MNGLSGCVYMEYVGRPRIVCNNKNICVSESDLPEGKNCPWGRKTEGTTKENTGFSSAQNTCKIYGVCSRVAVAHLSCFNCEHSHWLLLLWAECNHSYTLLHHVLTTK